LILEKVIVLNYVCLPKVITLFYLNEDSVLVVGKNVTSDSLNHKIN